MGRAVVTIVALLVLTSCAGKQQYTPPLVAPPAKNSVTINKAKDEVWKKIVPALGKGFFVINNLDKESGIINVSYSGDPEKYVDCGRISSYVKNARGERTYDFPASRAQQIYEVMDMEHGAGLLSCDRRMSLEGRINIIVEVVSSDQTTISVNTKYVLNKTTTVIDTSRRSNRISDAISFVSGQQETFPGGGSHMGTICRATGKLEEEVISILVSNLQ